MEEESNRNVVSCQTYINGQHSAFFSVCAGLTPFQTVPMSSQKCQRFRFEHPFTSMTAEMTKSGKASWVLSLLHQASEAIYFPPERIVWCCSQCQLAYTEMLVAMPHIEFIKGISTALKQDSYFDVNKQNVIVFDGQMIDASKDKRIVNLFTRCSHHRNRSEIYIVQNLFLQEGKSQHKPKRSLFAGIQESTRQIAKLDSGQANVSRANLLLVFSVTPFKIDQNNNQNRPIDKVQNLGNERRYIYKDPRQDSGQRNISYTRYPKKMFYPNL